MPGEAGAAADGALVASGARDATEGIEPRQKRRRIAGGSEGECMGDSSDLHDDDPDRGGARGEDDGDRIFNDDGMFKEMGRGVEASATHTTSESAEAVEKTSRIERFNMLLAATEAGTAASTSPAAARPPGIPDRPGAPDRPLENWWVGGLAFQNPGDSRVDLRRQIEEAQYWMKVSQKSEKDAVRLKTAPGEKQRMWPGMTKRSLVRSRAPRLRAADDVDQRRYITVARELELAEHCVRHLHNKGKPRSECLACRGQRKRAHIVSSCASDGVPATVSVRLD